MAQFRVVDAQAALGFLVSQTSIIEPVVYQKKYPDIVYPGLIPVDTSGNEWARSVTFMSQDMSGRAQWFDGGADDVPNADVSREKFEQMIEMAAIGYEYNLEELGFAMMVPGTNLTADRASAARRAYEEFTDRVAMTGDTAKGWMGLINNTSVSTGNAPADGTAGATTFASKTSDQILRDLNAPLSGIRVASNTVEWADTILLPDTTLQYIGTRRLSDATETTILAYFIKNNVYTMTTAQALDIRAVRTLETAGAGGTKRMMAYRKDPEVLKMHMPMPHRFLPAWQRGPLRFSVPGIFRLGGTEIRRPSAARYVDGI